MSTQFATPLHRWFEEVWNEGREEVVREMFPPDSVAYGMGDEPVRGPEEYLSHLRAWKSAMPDVRINVEDWIMDGDRIAVDCRAIGVHTNDGFGIKATKKQVDVRFMGFATLRDGKIVEARNLVDMSGFYAQLGVLAVRQTENEMLIRRWFDEVWNEKNEDSIDEMMASDGIHHGVAPEPVCGVENFKQFFRGFVSVFPDLKVTVEEAYAIDDKLCARYTATGTHCGEGLGCAPTGREVKFTGMGTCRIEEGKFAEVWNQIDFMTIQQQISAPQE